MSVLHVISQLLKALFFVGPCVFGTNLRSWGYSSLKSIDTVYSFFKCSKSSWKQDSIFWEEHTQNYINYLYPNCYWLLHTTFCKDSIFWEEYTPNYINYLYPNCYWLLHTTFCKLPTTANLTHFSCVPCWSYSANMASCAQAMAPANDRRTPVFCLFLGNLSHI